MAKQIARLLKADIQESSDLKSIAKMLSKKGRGGDTMLAHITPKEAKILKEAGGAGTVNPDTGLLEFYDGSFNIGEYGFDYGSDYARSIPDYIPPQQAVESPYTFSDGQATAPIDFTQQMAAQQYEGSAFPYTPGGNYQYVGQDVGDEFIKEFPSGMSPLYNLSQAQNAAAAAAAYPQGMMDIPADTGAATRPAIPGIPQEVREAPPPSLLSRAGDALSTIKAGGGDVLDYLKKNPDLVRLLGAGAGAVAGRAQSQQAARQIQQATQEQKNVGAPYQKTGAELQRAALAGELTPQSAQAFQALRAQMAQGIESRGGVGVAQAQAQLEAFRQNLLQNQYNFGLQVSQIGDQMALGAIRTGMQLDQQLAAANQQFYTQLASIAGGGTYQAPRG
jgi:hypothetical protein